MRVPYQDCRVRGKLSLTRVPWLSQLVLCLGVCALLLLAVPVRAEQLVRVGIYQNSPKVALAGNGKPEGIFVDVIEAIARNEGWRLEYVPGTWAEGLARLEAGDIDLMPDVANTAEREALYAFHREPVLASWNQVYTRRGSGVRSLLDLEAKTVAVLAGSVQEATFTQMASSFNLATRLVPYADYDAAFAAVARGTADAAITNRFFGVRNAGKYGLEDTAIIFSPSKLYFAAPRAGREALLAAIDTQLVAFKKDANSVYFQSMRRWSIEDVRPAAPAWLLPATLGTLAILLAGVAWVALLKRQVAAKTREIQRRNEEILVINRTLRVTGSQRDLGAVIDEAIKGALALTGMDGGRLDDTLPPSISARTATGKRHVLQEAKDAPPASGGPAVRWHVYFPLEVQDRTIGVLCLFSNRTRPPSVHSMELVEDLCGPVALAIENARLYQQAQEHTQELEERVALRTREIEELTASLEAILDHIANPIFYKDPELRFLGCNRAYEQAFGVKRADIVGKTVLDLEYLSMEDRRRFQDEQLQVFATGTTLQREAPMPFADGKIHQTLYSASSFRLPDGSPGGLVGAIVDITPLKDAESALRAANDEQNAIFEAANFGIALVQKHVIRRCNRKLEEIFGYAPGGLQGESTRVWYLSDQQFADAVDQIYAAIGRGGTHTRELELQRKDGGTFWCRLMARALDPADPAKGIVGVIEDVTEERAAAEALLDAKQRAESADRLKSAFLATMSHELRTPLNSIIGFTGIVLQGMAGPLTAEQSKQLGMVRDSSRHLLALINDVLDISKIEAGELKVAREPFDLPRSIEKVAALVRPLADKKHLALTVEVAQDLGQMVSDARRVEQVLLNLLGNAIKFSEAGKVTLRAEKLADFRLDARHQPVAGVLLTVTDTGIGIKPEDMDLLFAPFRQIDSTLSRQHEGTGLGLTICQRLTSLMGGRIDVQSEWGRGSVFTVTLPLQASAALETT